MLQALSVAQATMSYLLRMLTVIVDAVYDQGTARFERKHSVEALSCPRVRVGGTRGAAFLSESVLPRPKTHVKQRGLGSYRHYECGLEVCYFMKVYSLDP